MASALFIVSEEGYWGEECVEPLTTLDEAGFDITVATPSGSKPVIDDTSIDPDNPFVGSETAEKVEQVHETDDRLNNPIPIAEATAEEYDTIVYPGGHGVEWDVNQDHHARSLLRETIEGENGKVLVVCHTLAILAFARDNEGQPLANGRDVTGFPNEWEADLVDENDRLPDGRKLPYWVEDEVEAAGGNWDAELDQDVSVRVDGDLVTGRGPQSSGAAAETLLDELSR
ncbi:type 1 glutamine amidotransferase domain-containing protein [Haladaptatus sp.]|uniref:type 1 glutamine amidotransferase domain-containing protein n=1 Tax=Haladaptatus sp. TaxID=1973141 RepID=UPI003C510C0B